jgi:dihydrofolate reductase
MTPSSFPRSGASADTRANQIASQDIVFLGRRTYDEWAGYWPSSDNEPFASFINGVEKYVVTSTDPEVAWANTTIINGGLLDVVAELKGRSGGDIGIHGSLALTQSLLVSGLVDELQLVVAPALPGRGRRLLDEGTPRPLALISSVISPSGSLLRNYSGPGGQPDLTFEQQT